MGAAAEADRRLRIIGPACGWQSQSGSRGCPGLEKISPGETVGKKIFAGLHRRHFWNCFLFTLPGMRCREGMREGFATERTTLSRASPPTKTTNARETESCAPSPFG